MRVKIFFCYAREDEPLLNELQAHLRPLQYQGLIDVWHDREISAGTEWEQEIHKHLNEAQIILLLISPAFMNSDYCYGVEMKKAIERHNSGEARVIPIILRPVYWQGVLGKLQALPTDGKPVKSLHWYNEDEAYTNIIDGIRTIVENNMLTNTTKEVERAAFQISKPLLLFDGYLHHHPEYLDETFFFFVQTHHRKLQSSLDKLRLPIKIPLPTTDAELQRYLDIYSLDKLILQIGEELRLQHSPRAESIFLLHTQALVYTAAKGVIPNSTLAVMGKGVRLESEQLGLKAASIEKFLKNPKPNLQPLLDELEKSFQA